MKQRTKLALSTLILMSAIGISNARSAAYTVDPFHSNARFSIDHFNTSSNVGGFYKLTGSLHFDKQRNSGKIDISIPIESLQSSSKEFTEHLKSADLFNAKKFPTMKFVSKKWNSKDNKLVSVDGTLTLLGVTQPVSLTVDKFNCYDSPMLKTEVCGGDFSTVIDRTKWGMNYLVDAGITKEVKIDIQIEAAKK